MNVKEMNQLRDFNQSKNELKTIDLEMNKSVIRKIIRKNEKEELSSLQNFIKLQYQGKSIWRISKLSVSIFFQRIKADAEMKVELKKFIKAQWEERRETKKIYNYKYKTSQKNEIKNKFKLRKLELFKKFENEKKYVRDNKLLISRDGLTHENKFGGINKFNITEVNLAIKKIKTEFVSKKETKNIFKIKKAETKILIAQEKAKLSYNGIYEFEQSKVKLEFLKNKINQKNEYLDKKRELQEKIKDIDYSIKKIYKKIYVEEFWKKIKNKFNNLMKLWSFKIKSKEYKINKIEIQQNYRNELANRLKENEYSKIKFKISKLKLDYKDVNKEIKAIYISKSVSNDEKIPVKQSLFRTIIAPFTSLFLPGTGELINGQILKGFLMYIATMFSWLLLIYSMGFGNLEGNGIWGLRNLGAADNLWETKDARYFIIEGSLAVLFLSCYILYNVLSSYITLKISTAKYNGGRAKSWRETKNYFADKGYPIITSLPSMAMMLLVVMIPIVTTFLLAFTNYRPNNATNFEWNGINQFKALFTEEWGRTLKYVAGWTFTWTAITWFSSFFIALILASVINNQRVKGKILFRLIYVLPWAIPGFITILLFKMMFLPSGILSNLFNNHGFQTIPLYARISVIMIQMWSGYCVNMVLITGILQSIPKDLYEAAEMDGASGMSKMFKVTLPLIIFQMTPILVGQFMGAFNNFAIIYLYLDGGPFTTDVIMQGGAGTTETIASLIYKLISAGHVGIASALNVIVSGVIVTISVAILVRSRSVKGGIA